MKTAHREDFLADSTFDAARARIAERLGLNFPASKRRELERAFSAAASEACCRDAQACADQYLASSQGGDLEEALLSHLTVAETYFFREMRCFELLTERIMPAILGSWAGDRRPIRIWSAGCATGEEPYSIAIALHRMGSSLQGREVSILGTDINQRSLRLAAEGIYGEWSFRNAPPWLKTEYFVEIGKGRYRLKAEITSMVRFAPLNLAWEGFPSLLGDTNAMDLIFCRNVLMYFTRESASAVLARFLSSLVEEGWLIVGACESSIVQSSLLSATEGPETSCYRKQAPVSVAVFESGLQPPLAAPGLPSVIIPPLEIEEPAATHGDEEAGPRTASVESDKARSCRALADEGRLVEALELSSQVIAEDRLDAGYYCLRAAILEELGSLDEAAAALEKALYLDSDLVVARFMLGRLRLWEGRSDVASRHFRQALATLEGCDPDEEVPETEGIRTRTFIEMLKTMSASSAPPELAR